MTVYTHDNSFQKYLLNIQDWPGMDQAALGELSSTFLKEVHRSNSNPACNLKGGAKGSVRRGFT